MGNLLAAHPGPVIGRRRPECARAGAGTGELGVRLTQAHPKLTVGRRGDRTARISPCRCNRPCQWHPRHQTCRPVIGAP